MRTRELILGLIVLIWVGAAQADEERIESAGRASERLKNLQATTAEDKAGEQEIEKRARRHNRMILQMYGWNPYDTDTGEISGETERRAENEVLNREIQSLRYRRDMDNIDDR